MLEPIFYFLLGLVIGRWWALGVAIGLYWLHGLAVYLGIWPGSISTWSALQWWVLSSPPGRPHGDRRAHPRSDSSGMWLGNGT